MHVQTAVRLLPGTVGPNQDRRAPTWVSAYSALNGAIAREINRRSVENGDAPFPAGREAVRMFLRGFPVFHSWLSAQIVLGNAAARSEICRRFGGGSAGKSALLGNGRQWVHNMQCVQSRINTGDFASR